MRVLSSIKPYLDLCRVSNLPTVWTNVLTALVVSGAGFKWSNLLILSFSMSLFYSGGMCLNDLCDAEVDRIHKAFRPIPSNRISTQGVRVFAVFLFGVGLALLLLLPFPRAFYAGLFLLLLIIVYDEVHKRNPVSIFLMAGCRLLVFAVSAMAVTGTVGLNAWIAGSTQFIYILALSLVARYENTRSVGFPFPIIPWMLACICLVDGMVMAVLVSPVWLITGFLGVILTRLGQRCIRGD
ncbi:MAG: prenyltransferase [Deltaproteobacteria bacterium]|nr:MAG: prenyltransferase [Deltaproteobacteria bacterium]